MVSNGNSKITLGTSVDPEYHLKKKRIGELRYSLPANSILVMKIRMDLLLQKHMVVRPGLLYNPRYPRLNR